jgi:AmmeMemoRadiSam system protein A
MTESHPLVNLARQAIESFLSDGEQIQAPDARVPVMDRRAGTFVTIRRGGQLRGCIGTIEPVSENVATEVIRNAISAATRDPRFSPVQPNELAELEIKDDVLGEPEPVHSLEELDPRRYGLVVQSASQPWKRGLLLPDLEGIDTAEKQVYWTRHHKAGITDPDEPVQMFRFEVMRYS